MITHGRNILACVGLALCLSGCFAPKPFVTHTALRPPSAPNEPYLLTVMLTNQGSGEGQAEVTARLIAHSTGQTAAQANQDVDLKAHETVTIVLQLHAADIGDYDTMVEAQAPQE